eukprot:GHVQ01041929.1.p1 GENE.GHVQ01041929.1~~GHVQ01041929.1.p1  ORF type:complete len:1123 (+),score=159.67 GHVQ01041929.1:228-3596(+)
MMEGYELCGELEVKDVKIKEYKSSECGVRVLFADVDSPIVSGYFTVCTEAHTDEGLPHTLEHLVFLGSHAYPYKGILDLMANRCLSQGTNAWTSTDVTTYTLTCAGLEGFLNLLPVYVDHIMRPTLEDHAFLTEVCHVAEDGKSAGVVYSEMESRENTANQIMYRQLLKYVYPGESGYKYETGGVLVDIRKTSNKRVRDYHRQYYKWDNFYICIVGRVDHSSILQSLRASFTEYNLTHGQYSLPYPHSIETKETAEPVIKPWTESCNFEQLTESVVKSVEFPADDELTGKAVVAWRGCEWSNFVGCEVIDLLGTYLTEGNNSPLEEALVESEPPFCGSVEFSLEKYKSTYFELLFDDVPHKTRQRVTEGKMVEEDSIKGEENQLDKDCETTRDPEKKRKRKEDYNGVKENGNIDTTGCVKEDSKICLVVDEAMTVIKKVFDDGIDMTRMKTLIRRELLQFQRGFETSPHESCIDFLNDYCVNGDGNTQTLKESLRMREIYEHLLLQDATFWTTELRRLFIEAPRIEMRCVPSQSRADELQKQEKELQARQKKMIDNGELKDMPAAVAEAKLKLQKAPPADIVNKIPIADVNRVHLITQPVLYGGPIFTKSMLGEIWHSQKKAISDVSNGLSSQGRFVLHTNHIPSSEFVNIRVCARLPKTADALTMVLAELLFECDVEILQPLPLPAGAHTDIKVGEVLTHDKLTKLLLENTTEYGASIGLTGKRFRPSGFPECVVLGATIPIDRYETGVSLIQSVLGGTRVTEQRVAIQARKMASAIIKHKRSAKHVVDQMEIGLRCPRKSIYNLCGLAEQERLLQQILVNIKDNTAERHKPFKRLNTTADSPLTSTTPATPNTPPLTAEDKPWRTSIDKIVVTRLQQSVDSLFSQNPYPLAIHISADLNRLPALVEPWERCVGGTVIDTDIQTGGKGHRDAAETDTCVEEGCTSLRTLLDIKEGGDRVENIVCGEDSCLPPMLTPYESATTSTPGTPSPLGCNSVCVGLSSTDAAYVVFTVEVPVGFDYIDLAPLMVLAEFCSVMEGPLYKYIRGAGYAYGCDLCLYGVHGELSLRICPATNAPLALKGALKAFGDLVKDESCITDSDVAAAKASTMYSIIRYGQSNMML